MYKGDPKRPKNIREYKEKPIEDFYDTYQFISMILGIVALVFKFKWGVWLSLIFLMCSWLNVKNNQENKNFIMNFTMIMIGFFTVYLTPKPRIREKGK